MHTDEAEDLRLLYQITTSDLTYFKTQQWSVAYYCFLIHAGLVGVATAIAPLNTLDKCALGGLATLAAVAALIVLAKLQTSIVVRQARLKALRAHFGPAFIDAWSAGVKGREYLHSVYLLYGGVIITTALTWWLIAQRIQDVARA